MVNIQGVCETRQANNEDFASDKHRIIYADGGRKAKEE